MPATSSSTDSIPRASRSRSAARDRRMSGASSSARRRQPAATSTPRIPGEKRVFLVSSFLDSTFNKTPFALRDKVILKIDRQKADGLDLAEGADERSAGQERQRLDAREAACRRAPTSPSSRARSSASASAQMVGITDENASDLAKYGLDKPTATITVVDGQLARDAAARQDRERRRLSRRMRRGRWCSPSRRR